MISFWNCTGLAQKRLDPSTLMTFSYIAYGCTREAAIGKTVDYMQSTKPEFSIMKIDCERCEIPEEARTL